MLKTPKITAIVSTTKEDTLADPTNPRLPSTSGVFTQKPWALMYFKLLRKKLCCLPEGTDKESKAVISLLQK